MVICAKVHRNPSDRFHLKLTKMSAWDYRKKDFCIQYIQYIYIVNLPPENLISIIISIMLYSWTETVVSFHVRSQWWTHQMTPVPRDTHSSNTD